ncbi:hypothetical protein Q8F55_002988 [Vanrija albida]|uniref:F-box domain-containing protein n=1 Tax=Vanrija albida TaxID=181172 RepID=A0ABR3QC99_9TREE
MDIEVRLAFPSGPTWTPASIPRPLAVIRAFAREHEGVRVVAGRGEVRVYLEWGKKDPAAADSAFAAFLGILAPPASFALSFPTHNLRAPHLFRPPSLAGLRTDALHTLQVQNILEMPSAWDVLHRGHVSKVLTSLSGFTDRDYAHAAARLPPSVTRFCVDPGCGDECHCFSWVFCGCLLRLGPDPGEEGMNALSAVLDRNHWLTVRSRSAAAHALTPARVLLHAEASPVPETQRRREVVRLTGPRLDSRSRSPSRVRRRTACGATHGTATPHLAPRRPSRTTMLSLPAEVLHLILRFVSADPGALSPAQWARLFGHAADREAMAHLRGFTAAREGRPFAKLMDRWLDSGGFVWEVPVPG